MLHSKYRVALIESRSSGLSFQCKMFRNDAKKLGLTAHKSLAALTKQKHDTMNGHGLLVSINVIDELASVISEKSHSDEYTLTLTVCKTFLRHYSLAETDILYIQSAKCLSLKCVVFGAKTQAAYDWIRSDGWSDRLLVSTVQQPILCRRGDILLADPRAFPGTDPSLLLDLVALDSSPVLQGLLTMKTSVTLMRAPREVPSAQQSSNTSHNMHSIINLMTYTSRLLLPASSNSTSHSPSILNKAIMRIFNKKFPVSILTKPLRCTNALDVHSIVFLNQQVLNAYKLVEGSWARVRLSQRRPERESWSSDPLDIGGSFVTPDRVPQRQMSIPPAPEEETQREKMVQLCPLPHQGDSVARVTPLLWFNLNGHPSPLEQPGRKLLLQELGVDPPPFAKEVYMSLVQTPNYKVSLNCDPLLRQYFSLTRCLQKGDILALPTSGHTEACHHNWKDCLEWPVVYFQVSSIDGPPSAHFRVDTQHTKLYQSGACQGYLPVTMEAYSSLRQLLHPLWHSHCPPGFAVHVRRLCQLISPFLQDKEFRGQVSSCILLRGQSGSGKSLLVRAVSRCLNLQIFSVESQELVGESPGATEARFKNVATRALSYAPCILLLKDVHAVGKEKEAMGEDPRIVSSFCEMLSSLGSSQGTWPVVTVATSNQALGADLEGVFLYRLVLEPPSREQRALMLPALLSPLQTSGDISWTFLAQRTTGLVLGDLSMLVTLSCQEAFFRVKSRIGEDDLTPEEADISVALSGVPLTQADLVQALDQMHRMQAQAIGAPQIPDVRWEDIGGLKAAKDELLDTVQLPLLYPHLLQVGLRRSGVLLHGPPGTGKTLLAKAVATECSLSFLSVKGPELISAYVGQSEENIRLVFERARSAAPCIIFFDELDSLGPNRGRSGDSGGVMDRVVSQLLAELDGLHKSKQVFVIGATNRPDLLDPALLRPGRFDRLVNVGLAQDPSGRLGILQALTRKFCLSPDVDLASVESLCPADMSGADFYGLCADANMAALERCIRLIEKGEVGESEASPEVTTADFLLALQGRRRPGGEVFRSCHRGPFDGEQRRETMLT